MIGWGNLSVQEDELKFEFGYVQSQPRDRSFKRELEAEMDRMRVFLGGVKSPTMLKATRTFLPFRNKQRNLRRFEPLLKQSPSPARASVLLLFQAS